MKYTGASPVGTTKMVRGLENVAYEQSLETWDCSALRRESRGGIFLSSATI